MRFYEYDTSCLDQYEFSKSYINKVVMIFEGRLDVERLRSSLENVIKGPLKVYGSRIKRTSEGQLRILIPEKFNESNPPFKWTIRDRSGCSISEEFSIPSYKSMGQDVITTPNFDVPRIFGNVTEYGPKYYINKPQPCVSMYITKYCDVTAVLFAVTHILCDGGGMSILLQAWQDELISISIKPVQMKWHLPEITDVGSRYMNMTVADRWYKFFAVSKTLIDYIRNGLPETRRFVFSAEYMERLRIKVMQDAKEENIRISRFDLLAGICAKLSSAARSKPTKYNVSSTMNLRYRLPGNERYARNFFLVLPYEIESEKLDSLSFSQFIIQRKKFVKRFMDDPEDLARHIAHQEFVNPKPLWMDLSGVNLINSDWSCFQFSKLDMSSAVLDESDKTSNSGKVVFMEPILMPGFVTDKAIMNRLQGPYDQDQSAISLMLLKANWSKAEAALGGIEKYIKSLADDSA
ncbi:hypothetical protein V1511DRAFT_510794 [Dipodascopsis uninucleata]